MADYVSAELGRPGTADHYDLTTENIVFDSLPPGARLVRKDTRCWSGSQGSRSCTP